MARRNRVTIKQVAAEAGVSITTVSHVLNEVPGVRVSPVTRQRIHDVANRLGYVPNVLAQSLRGRRSNTIGLVGDEVITTPFAGKIILGAQEVALEHDTVLFVVSTGYQRELESREIEELLRRQVDGILYASMFHRRLELPRQLAAVPTVFVNAECTTTGVPWVVPDEEAGGADAAEVLIRAGHRRLAFVNNVDEIPASEGRLRGFLKRVRSYGIPEDAVALATCESDAAGGYVAGRELLSRTGRPTGVFCFNDRVAMGLYRAAGELGLRIPGDVSVVGFDNQEYVADGLAPGLTTIELPHYEMGVWAAEQLFSLIGDEHEDRRTEPGSGDAGASAAGARLLCPVIVRESVAPPKTTAEQL